MDNPNQKDKALVNLRKANSHLAKIVKMLENNEYCVNIMQQNLAVIGLLKSANQLLLANHLNTCFKKVMATNNKALQQKMIKEILTVDKLNK